MMFTLPTLSYAYDALEPVFDAETMRIHHQKHHQSYIDQLNLVLTKQPHLHEYSLEEILTNLYDFPRTIRETVKNMAGGHYNHSLFWKAFTPRPTPKIDGMLLQAIRLHFDTLDNFKKAFTRAALEHFGSGWAWLCVDEDDRLSVFTTKDHECPVSQGFYPLYVLDLWEHAYYLKYRHQKLDYINASWKFTNWEEISQRFNLRGAVSPGAHLPSQIVLSR